MSFAIIRHKRENRQKCSLRGLEDKFPFYTYPWNTIPDLSSFLLLDFEGPLLTAEDSDRDILLIDGTWALAQTIKKQLPWPIASRSLPRGFQTAYPRRQTGCPLPEYGLVSVEALYVAAHILERPSEELLLSYHWKTNFLKLNEDLIKRAPTPIFRSE